MGREMQVELTNMCMVCDGGKVLVQDRAKPGWSGITFPGGHVEPGESVVDSVIREVREETGLTVANPRLRGVKDWMRDDGSRYMVLLFTAEEFSGQLAPSKEGNVFWAERDSLPDMALASGMEETFRVFFEEEISELFYSRKDENAPAGEWRYEDWKYKLQ